MRSAFSYLKWAFIVTAVGLAGSFLLGYSFSGTLSGAWSFLFVGSVLAVLEISLSFDNAIVNANKLNTMSPLWQKRFLTWGILIAVFGMRIVFPLAVVSVAARLDPISAIYLAMHEPHHYAEILHDAHLPIAAFGGTFLLMVALNFFVDAEKEVDWFHPVERGLRSCAGVRGLTIAVVVTAILLIVACLPPGMRMSFLSSSTAGLATFIVVDVASRYLDHLSDSSRGSSGLISGGLGAFLYLEALDASFSFDGVIGAFVLTQNLFLIAIGLGIGAMYVRSMTIMIVERGTLASYRYLEHGAFWSILALSVVMYLQVFFTVPDALTGLIGASLIGLSLASSIRFNRANRAGR